MVKFNLHYVPSTGRWLMHSCLINEWKKVKVKSLSRVRLFATPWTVAHQAPPSMGFSRQEYWSGLPLPSPGDLPHPGIEPRSPTLQADALTSEPPGKPLGVTGSGYKFLEGERCLFSYSLILQKDILGILGICSLTWYFSTIVSILFWCFTECPSLLCRVWLFSWWTVL